jgi:hypothetical protein
LYTILVLLHFLIYEGYLYPILLDFLHYLDNEDGYEDGMLYARGPMFDPVRDLNPDHSPQADSPQPNPDGMGPSSIIPNTHTDYLDRDIFERLEKQKNSHFRLFRAYNSPSWDEDKILEYYHRKRVVVLAEQSGQMGTGCYNIKEYVSGVYGGEKAVFYSKNP